MIIFPGSKINIGLNIIRKRDDGFHDIESVFYPLPWTDILEGIVADKDEITITGLHVDCSLEDNLITKAINLLRREYHFGQVKIHLHKVVPMGAGLGGGSADAAATILLLNDLFRLQMSDVTMEDYARVLGSDCAFFIRKKPVFAYAKGDVFKDISLDLSGWKIIVIKPEVHIGTKEAYAGIVPLESVNSIEKDLLQNVEQWKDTVKNDFEASIFKNHPQIKDIKDFLINNGADYASMSGSGASVYGLYSPDKSLPQININNAVSWIGVL